MTSPYQQSADEVIERLGAHAIEYLSKRIDRLLADGMNREVDQAYLLLNEVERILAQRPH